MGILKAYHAYKEIKRDVKTASQLIYGTSDLGEVIKMSANEPEPIKSVSGMTAIYLPLIANDFPDFNLEEFKNRTATLLTSALLSITKEDSTCLMHASDNLQDAIQLRIHNNQLTNTKESYTSAHIHKMEIRRYTRTSGTCIITLQCAIEYYYTKFQNGTLVEGNETKLDQTKYDIQLIYIQDMDQLDSTSSHTFSTINCPNCGGNQMKPGTNICAYCDSTLEELNIKVWEIDSFKEC